MADIPKRHPAIDEVVGVRAGKWRRYHGEGWRQLFDLKTMAKNLRDAFYVLIGLGQSWCIVQKYKPAGIFVKGGFVGVPIGLVAGWKKIPYITHDSDAIPGLANRIIAKHAAKHAVAMPVEAYSYPKDRTVHVGVPVDEAFEKPTQQLQQQWRKELGIAAKAPVVCLTGGGNGSELLNTTLVAISSHLQAAVPGLVILHITGRDHAEAVQAAYGDQQDVRVIGFTSELYKYTGVADVVVARAGANSLADFARQGRACIIIPNPLLTGGHQLKNAQLLALKHAIKIVDEADLRKDPEVLSKQIITLLLEAKQRQNLSDSLSAQAKPAAAADLAELLLRTFSQKETADGKA